MIIFQKENEKLESIGGTFGESVMSLYFTTNKRTYGPYGQEEGTRFSLPTIKSYIVGFFGDCGDLLDSIGVFIQFHK
ncbi:hypothetical protein OSB04_001644 [Centaurea solstitialis]|uniref:Jacalin-type lectin domain-containing protein n=1 Tax=Centaurea solstitialis TaxID=347529 RepID=A0AA38TRD1_9ASTR|nr:hypothetical protein OSB04_001644 [Centaurea solstitialis]